MRKMRCPTSGKVGRYDTRQTPVQAVFAQAGDLVDVTISDPTLEQVIRTIYGERNISPPWERGG